MITEERLEMVENELARGKRVGKSGMARVLMAIHVFRRTGVLRGILAGVLAVFIISNGYSAETIAPNEVVSQAKLSVVTVVMTDIHGISLPARSGFVTEEGFIVTNFRGMAGAASGYAILGEQLFKIQGIAAYDQYSDLAVMMLVNADLPGLPLADSGEVVVGQEVFVVGGLEGMFSDGTVRTIRSFDDDRLIQITAPISPGSIGGPVLASDGTVIGVAVVNVTNDQTLNFAIPSYYVKRLIAEAEESRVKGLTTLGPFPSDTSIFGVVLTDDGPKDVLTLEELYIKYRCRFALVDGEYMKLPEFRLRFRNSRNGSPLPETAYYTHEYSHVWQDGYTVRVGVQPVGPPGERIYYPKYKYVPGGWKRVKQIDYRSSSEVQVLKERWETELPQLRVGHFGIWPTEDELVIIQILDRDNMLARGGNRSIELKGWNTTGMRDGGSLQASTIKINMAIIGEKSLPGFGDAPVLLAIPVGQVRDGLTMEQFMDLQGKHPDWLKD